MFSLGRDWSIRVTWPNILEKYLKDNWRILNTIATIWHENIHAYLSFDIICSSKLKVFLELRPRKTVRFSQQIMFWHIFAPSGDYCLYKSASNGIDTMLYKYGKNTRNFWGRYYLYLCLFYLVIVGYEMINEIGATYLYGFLLSHVISNTRLWNN